MWHGTENLSAVVLISAWSRPQEDPTGMLSDLYRAFARVWSRPKTVRRPRPLRATPSRRRKDFELPAYAAGRANPSAPGRTWRSRARVRSWREGAGERRVTLSPQGIAFSRALPPSPDESDPGGRRTAPAYPLFSGLPGAYYILSGAAAGRRVHGAERLL